MTWLNKLFNIRSSEWTRLLLLALVLVVSNIGTNWGTTVAYAAFLKQSGLKAGMETLIWVLFLSSLLSIPALSLYTAFVDRIDNNRLFVYIIAAGAVIILAGMGLWGLGFESFAFPFMYVLSQAWLAIFNPHFFTYINDLFDIQSAKRALPIVLAAGRIGAAIAGFTLKPLAQILDSASIIWIWLASDILVIGVLLLMPRFIKKNRSAIEISHLNRPAAQTAGTSYFASLKEGLNFTLQSAFLRWMAAGTLLLAALVNLFEYHANQIMSPQFASSSDYAGFLGMLDGISNVIALLILLFGISRMSKAWGIGNTSLVFPALTLLISGGLVGLPALFTASLAHLDRKGLRFSLQAPIEALLYNAIPIRIKGRARAFVGGLLAPLGAMLGVGILLIELWYGENFPWLIPAAIALFTAAYFISSFFIRHQYTQALVKMLEEEDFSFLLTEGAEELVAADPATLERLKKKLEESSSHELRVFITQLIAQVGGAEALTILIPAVKAATEARTRAAMLDVITAAGLRGEMMRELYSDSLTDPDPQVRQSAAAGLEQMLGSQDPWLRELLVTMVNDPNSQVSLYALKSLAGTGNFFAFEPAVWKLDDLLKSESFESKKAAIDVLGLIADPKSVRQLLEFLPDENTQIRLEAILSLEKMPLPLGNSLDKDIADFAKLLAHDPVARVRQAALTIFAKFKNKETPQILISALADKSPQVRTAAVDLLVSLGKEAVPALQAAFNSSDLQTQKMSVVALSRINPRQFAPQIDKIVSQNLNQIYRAISLEDALTPYQQYRSARALISALRERNKELISEILYLLSAIHDPQTLKVVGESLHSDSAATRNLALEALESLTSPQTAALIASLFEPSMGPAQLLQLGQEGSLSIETFDIMNALTELAEHTIDRVRFLLSLHVMGDIGAQFAKANDPRAEQIRALINPSLHSNDELVEESARDALQKINTLGEPVGVVIRKPLSMVEKMIILKEVPFFRNIPVAELEAMARVCEEKIHKKDSRIFKTGDPGGALYIIVDGQVKIEQEKRSGSTTLATLGNDSYFGEMSLFDNSPRSASAIAMRETVILELNRAPIMSLTMQNPDMALELINMLSQRIRETSDKLADTVKSRPRELHKLFDQFES